ncbi:hypothetical protein ACH79_18855 [Bradyrhizobium sp. CCBAU 051011]|nr:hypothetical protein ACH79_18855 [Bradyrhizobium sp. CCBAU 051011]
MSAEDTGNRQPHQPAGATFIKALEDIFMENISDTIESDVRDFDGSSSQGLQSLGEEESKPPDASAGRVDPL